MVDTSWYVDGGWRPVFLDDPRTEPFWAEVERRGIPVFLHPPLLPYGFRSMTKYRLEEAVGRPADTALSVARLILSGAFERHPDLKVVLAHVGGALLAAMGRLDFTYRLGYEGLPEGEGSGLRATAERVPASQPLRRHDGLLGAARTRSGSWGATPRSCSTCTDGGLSGRPSSNSREGAPLSTRAATPRLDCGR